MRKGFWRTFESVLAVIILVFFMIALGVKYTVPGEEQDLSRTGYEILRSLDGKGELRSYVVNNQTGELESKISIPGYDHVVQICNPEGCYGNEAGDSNVWVSTYIISGENAYDPYEIKLLIW
jgi:hypothetical protein